MYFPMPDYGPGALAPCCYQVIGPACAIVNLIDTIWEDHLTANGMRGECLLTPILN